MNAERKLNPLQFRTLVETRTDLGSLSWRDVGVKEPTSVSRCWGEVRLRGSRDYAPSFESCANAVRSGFLTCLVHHDRELAARELKCEINDITMKSIAYDDWQDEQAHRAQIKAARAAARGATTQ